MMEEQKADQSPDTAIEKATEQQPPAPLPPPPNERAMAIQREHEFDVWRNMAQFDMLWKVAGVWCNSRMAPERYHKQQQDTAIVIAMAWKHGGDIMSFLQSVYIVHNQPAMDGKLAIALVNQSGVFRGPINYTYEGEGPRRKCTAWAIHAKTGERHEMTVSIEEAEAEGWTRERKGQKSKWVTLPDLMLRYRSAMYLIRTVAPEVLFGMHTVDELQDGAIKAADYEVLNDQQARIKDKVAGAQGRLPEAPAVPADEAPLSETMAEAARVIDVEPPADEPPVDAEFEPPPLDEEPIGQGSLLEPPKTAVQQTRAQMEQERVALINEHADLCGFLKMRQTGVHRKTNDTLRKEIAEMEEIRKANQ